MTKIHIPTGKPETHTEWGSRLGLSLKFQPTTKNGQNGHKNFDDWAWWNVSISNGQQATDWFDYGMGPGHKRWKIGSGKHGNVSSFQKEYRKLYDRKRMEPTPPKLSDVLYSVAHDSHGVIHGETFAEWCEEYGYGEGSNPAELHRTYEGCRDNAASLRTLVGHRELEALTECEEGDE